MMKTVPPTEVINYKIISGERNPFFYRFLEKKNQTRQTIFSQPLHLDNIRTRFA